MSSCDLDLDHMHNIHTPAHSLHTGPHSNPHLTQQCDKYFVILVHMIKFCEDCKTN